MPYRLRVTEEEVRQELAKMGFTGLSDDTVAAIRKDLLKMIKSDLRKLRCEGQDTSHTDTSDPQPPLHHKPAGKPFFPKPKITRTKDTAYSSLSASQDQDDSTGESGYSDVESTMSDTSEAANYSSASEAKQRKPEKVASKDLKESKGVSRPHRQPEGMSHVGVGPAKKATNQTKTKQVRKKGLPQYPSRPDPVRLYHYYKAHWDQHKVPGQDPRLKLRWAVRSKLFYAE